MTTTIKTDILMIGMMTSSTILMTNNSIIKNKILEKEN